MINFYREDNMGKIAFADGVISAPSGHITLYADNSTNQIIIAEDGRSTFWIGTGGELRVNNVVITGSVAEKAALIAPVFVNTTGSGSGTSARFGFAGEDDSAAENRNMNMQGHSYTVDLASIFELWATNDDFTFHSHIVGDDNNLRLDTDNSAGQAQTLMDATASQILADTTYKGATGSQMKYCSMSLQPKWIISNPEQIPFIARFLTTLANLSQSDIRIPFVEGRHYVPISFGGMFADPETGDIDFSTLQSFANNDDAVAVLGVGKPYTSTIPFNGSLMILITQ
jgi:hypothetical protein